MPSDLDVLDSSKDFGGCQLGQWFVTPCMRGEQQDEAESRMLGDAVQPTLTDRMQGSGFLGSVTLGM